MFAKKTTAIKINIVFDFAFLRWVTKGNIYGCGNSLSNICMDTCFSVRMQEQL